MLQAMVGGRSGPDSDHNNAFFGSGYLVKNPKVVMVKTGSPEVRVGSQFNGGYKLRAVFPHVFENGNGILEGSVLKLCKLPLRSGE
jgi:hypothetical protein